MIDTSQTPSGSPDAESFEHLLARVRKGSDSAARVIVDRYEGGIRRYLRRRLPRKLQSVFDSCDFAQLMWASVFANRDNMPDFHHPEQLAAYFLAVAKHKLIDECRGRLVGMKKNEKEKRSIFSTTIQRGMPGAAQPTASEVAIGRETLKGLLQNQPPEHRQILEWRAAGLTNVEIGARLGIHENSVRRIVHQLYRGLAET